MSDVERDWQLLVSCHDDALAAVDLIGCKRGRIFRMKFLDENSILNEGARQGSRALRLWFWSSSVTVAVGVKSISMTSPLLLAA